MTRAFERVVLASASPRRLELLRSVGFDVIVAPSDYIEHDDGSVAPLELARRHARGKLDAALRGGPSPFDSAPSGRYAQDDSVASAPIVVAADTVVDVDGESLGKPRDAAEAAAMLRRLSGREHIVHSAFAMYVPNASIIEESESTRVRFCVLDDAEIEAYVATGEPMDKAGAYGIQGKAAALVAGIDGDFYTVMGFPLGRFLRTLRRGVDEAVR